METNQESLIGTLQQQLLGFCRGFRLKAAAASDRFHPIEPLITFQKEVLEAQILA